MKKMLCSVASLSVLASGIMIAQTAQKTFDTPEAAVAALIAAVQSGNADEMTAVLGEDMKDQFNTKKNAVANDLDRAQFLESAQTATRIENDTVPGRMIVYFGANEWPFPAPLVQEGDKWRFDGKAGREEVLNRRIGHNEMHAVEICLGYVEAQLDYARTDHDGSGILEYARRLISSPGKHDGIYWPADETGESPFGPSISQSDRLVSVADTNAATPRPRYHSGYHFRVLTAQGANAPGGARNFLVDGHLMGGFGLIAWPRDYGVTGVLTFTVNQLGVVYAKDLGPDTATVAPAITAFDPDPSWKKMEPGTD